MERFRRAAATRDDSFDFIEAWDAAVKERQTVPSVTTQMLIADAVTAHLTTTMSKKKCCVKTLPRRLTVSFGPQADKLAVRRREPRPEQRP